MKGESRLVYSTEEMSKYDEYYFNRDNNKGYDKIEDILSEDEQILWRGKPKKRAFFWNSCIKMMPIALIWLIVDSFIIVGIFHTPFEEIGLGIIFFIAFFALHLMPVWIWIGQMITAGKRHKNLEYAFTEKRIIIKSGVIALDFKNIYYVDIDSVNVKVGFLDKIFKVGDIYISSHTKSSVLEDLEDPYFLTQKLQEIVNDIKTDVLYPNSLRPENNPGYNTKYKK